MSDADGRHLVSAAAARATAPLLCPGEARALAEARKTREARAAAQIIHCSRSFHSAADAPASRRRGPLGRMPRALLLGSAASALQLGLQLSSCCHVALLHGTSTSTNSNPAARTTCGSQRSQWDRGF
jgi:hypothetical protein